MIRLTDASIKNAKALAKDYVMGDGYGLQLKVRTNGSKLWNFNSYHPVTKKRLNIGLDAYLWISFKTMLMVLLIIEVFHAENVCSAHMG